MAATQALDFVAGGEEGFYLLVAEHGKAVDDDGGIANHVNYLFRFEFPVGVVTDGEDDGINSFQRGF